MITGTVNTDLEAIISLSVCSSNGTGYTQDAVIDTGFDGWLSLPPNLIAQLNLRWRRRGRALLGDGSECIFDVYEAIVVCDGSDLAIPIDEADSDPLLRMSLIEGYQLTIQVFAGGSVAIQKVSEV